MPDEKVIITFDGQDDLSALLDTIRANLQQVADGLLSLEEKGTSLESVTTYVEEVALQLDDMAIAAQTSAEGMNALQMTASDVDNALTLVQLTLDSVSTGMDTVAQAAGDLSVEATPLQQDFSDIADTAKYALYPSLDFVQGILVKLSNSMSVAGGDLVGYLQKQLDTASASRSMTMALLDQAKAIDAESSLIDGLQRHFDALGRQIAKLSTGLGELAQMQDVEQTLETVDADTQALETAMVGLNTGLVDTEALFASIAETPVAQSLDQAAMGVENLTQQFGANTEETLAANNALQSEDQSLSIYAQMANEAAAANAQLNQQIVAQQQAMQENAAATDEDTTAKDANNEAGMGSAYMLLFVGQMAVGAARNFLGMGIAADQSLTTFQAMTQTSDAQMQQFTTTLENMAVQSGYGLKDLTDSMYSVASSGYSANDSIAILHQSVMLARAGNANLSDTTSALVTVLNNYGHNAANAAQYSNDMTQAVVDGKQTFAEFNSQIAVVADNAKAAGLSFKDVASAESVVSLHFKDGQQAARDLEAMMRAVGESSDLVAATMTKEGLSFDAASYGALDLGGKLEYLNTLTAGNTAKFVASIGGMAAAKQAMASLGLTTQQLAQNAANLGIKFDATKFHAMNAGQQLQYLMNITGGNEAEFQSLVGGANNLNAAFAHVDLSTKTVGQEALKLGLHFDAAKYQSENLKDRLMTLWDATGHNVGEFRKLVGGVYGANAALAIISNNGAQYNKVFHDMTTAQEHGGVTAAKYAIALTSWSAQSQRASAAAQNLSTNIVELVKPAAAVFFAGLATAMQFLAQHADIVIPVIGALAIVIVAVLVPALWGAAAAALSLEAVAWPVVAVVAAIALVALLMATHWKQVVAAMQPVIHIFQTVIAALAPFFGALGHQLGAVFGRMGQDFQQLGSALAPLLPGLKMLGAVIGGIVIVEFLNLLAVVTGVISGIVEALATFVAGLLTVLGGIIHIITGIVNVFQGFFTLIHGLLTHNQGEIWKGVAQIFQGVQQIFQGALQVVAGMFQMIFGTILAFLHGFIMGFLGFWNGLFQAVISSTTGAFHNTVALFYEQLNMIVQSVSSFVNSIIQFFVHLWDELVGHSIIPDMVSGILNWFNNLVTQGEQFISNLVMGVLNFFLHLEQEAIIYINLMVSALLFEIQHLHDTIIQIILAMIDWFLTNILHMNTQSVQYVNQMVTNIIGSIQHLISQMFSFGADMISNFINGIKSMAGGVGNAIGGIAQHIRSFLHFTHPDTGPLADFDTYAPDMVNEFIRGMDAGSPALKAASARMASSIGGGMNFSTSVSLGTSPIVAELQRIHQTLLSQQRATTGGPVPVAGIGSVTQQFGPVSISGASNAQALYAQLNLLAGYAYEYGRRGATAGLPL